MKIKRTALFAALLATVIGTQAEVVIGFNELPIPADDLNYGTNAVLTFSDLAATNGITFSAPEVVDSVQGAQALGVLDPTADSFDAYTAPSGSFTITMEATGNYNPSTHAYATGANVIRGERNSTAGVGVTDNRMRTPEALVFTVDLDQDFIDSGVALQLTHLNGSGTSANRTSNVYDKDGNLVMANTGADNVAFAVPLTVADGDTFVFYAAGGNSGRIQLGHMNLEIVVVASTNTPPVITDITAYNSRVELDWIDDLNQDLLDHYNVYRSLTSNEVDFALLASPSNSAYTDLDVTNNVTYYYMAKAVDTNGTETAFGNMVSATPVNPVPTGLSAQALNTKVALDWNNSPDDLFASFNVWRSLESGSNFVNIASVTGSAYTDTGLTNGVAYYYKVSQVDTNGAESARSAQVSATPAVPVPTGLAAVPDNQEVALDWDASIDDMFASFNVWRSLESGTNYVNIGNVTTNSYTDNDVTNDVVYYYKVSQLDTNGQESARSAAVVGEPANGTVLIDFRASGGGAGGTQTITLDDLGNDPVSYARSTVNFGGAGLSSAAKDSFTVSTATGQIVIKGRAYSDDGPLNDGTDDFQPLTWSGGDITNTFEGTTGAFNSSSDGTGVQDASGTLSINPGEAVLIQFDLSGFTNAAGTSLVIKEITGGAAGKLYQRNFDVATGVSGAGEAVLNADQEGTIVVEDGDTFAWMHAARLGTLTLDIVETVTGYDAFASQYGLVEGALGDDDHDGVSNLGEYAINGNPTNGADTGQTSLGQDGSVFTYIYASNTVDSALTYRLIDSTSLTVGPFGTNNNAVAGVGPAVDDYASVTNTYGMTNDTLFINLEVEK